MFLFKYGVGNLQESSVLKNESLNLCKVIQKILNEQNEAYLDYIKNEEAAIFKKKFNEELEKFLSTL